MTDRYAVIGNPIAHSKSPLIHAEFARQTGQDLNYTSLLAPLDAFARCVREFQAAGGKGLNVTVPFKQEAWKLATRLTPRAELAQAVNTLKFEGEAILGDNTDGAGLVRDISANLGFAIQGKRILLMGAGGAARGVILPLLEQRPALFAIANRTPARAHELARLFLPHGELCSGDYASLAGQHFDLVINATSSSLHDELPPLPDKVFASGSLAYDMMYGKGLTPFLQFAQTNGAAQLADGLGMLVEQAAESFFLWRGVRPDTRPVMAMLKSL
ncbi:MAG: shikimate dehydrogenase [Sulfuricella sp.]|jgi:shikimate dehydrogenase|nr:shikimate dehydrogenase [Sulfuricella sp.]